MVLIKGHLKGQGRGEKAFRGFSLIELLVGFAIMVTAVAGILLSYLRCFELNEISRNVTFAVEGARGRMETVKATAFDQIKATYDRVAFVTPGVNGRGVVYVDDGDPDLMEVAVSVSWRQRNGRVYGEDANLNGALDAGEDQNGNGLLDSPVQMVSAIYKR